MADANLTCNCPCCRQGIEAPHEYHLERRPIPGTSACPVCGKSTPHHHTEDEVQVARLMAMPESEVDAELRRLGIDPAEAERQGKAAVEGALAAIRARNTGAEMRAEPVAYASSNPARINQLLSARQYQSCLPKNRVDFDIPLYAQRQATERWHNVARDGFPPCDGHTTYIGINSAGYACCFNVLHHGLCIMRTAEGAYRQMSDLRQWRPLHRPPIDDAGECPACGDDLSNAQGHYCEGSPAA
jgi:uncharacterized Zn finger protein (UPF0148 family)